MKITVEVDTDRSVLTLEELIELMYEQYYITDTFTVDAI